MGTNEHGAVIVKRKRDGQEFYVIRSMRGRYFDLVPKTHPAQKPVRFDRRDFESEK